ncbi:MAG: ATP-dependent metallopeptidase FtsH/Yme1/Tma family protein, partial [Christensenellales bacterium]
MKKNPMQGPFKYLLLLVLLAVIAFALSNQNGNISNEKSYSELLTMIEEGQIEQVAIQSNTLVARLVGSKVPQDAFPSRYDINVQLPSTDTFYT